MKKHITFFFLAAMGATLSVAQVPPKNIKDLAFMAGKWTTHSAWGDMEENWSEPMGNNMMCSYRCVKDGKVIFYEFRESIIKHVFDPSSFIVLAFEDNLHVVGTGAMEDDGSKTCLIIDSLNS